MRFRSINDSIPKHPPTVALAKHWYMLLIKAIGAVVGPPVEKIQTSSKWESFFRAYRIHVCHR